MFIPMINMIIIKFYYLQIQEYEILKYIPYVHSSCVRKRIVVKLLIKRDLPVSRVLIEILP